MSYAIIEAGGTQLRVEPGRFYEINRLPIEPGDRYVIDKVLLVNANDSVSIGRPYIDGATVEGTAVSHRRGRKIIVYKMRPKKKTRKKRGHRQELTRLMIDSISIDGTIVIGESKAKATPTSAVELAPVAPEGKAAAGEVTAVEVVAEVVADRQPELSETEVEKTKTKISKKAAK
jgi:large subunit ribosomal protein L21